MPTRRSSFPPLWVYVLSGTVTGIVARVGGYLGSEGDLLEQVLRGAAFGATLGVVLWALFRFLRFDRRA